MGQHASLRRKGERENAVWYIWFRHPVLGKPLERSLKTADAKKAEDLAKCLDLILADPAWHRRVRPGTPPEIVAAFYEPIKGLLEGVRFFEDPPTKIEYGPDGSIKNWSYSPAKQAEADTRVAEDSFQVLRLKRRYARVKELLRRRTEMVRHLTQRIGELERRLTGKGTPSLQAAYDLFAEVQRGKVVERTRSSRLARVRRFIAAVGNERPVGAVKPGEIDEFICALKSEDGKAATPVTRRNYRVEVGTFLNWCARKWDFTSPMPNTEKIRSNQERGIIVYLAQQEVETMLEQCLDLYWRTMLAAFVFSGVRASELRWLQNGDVDTDNRVISVRTVKTPYETKVPKTGSRAIHYHQSLQPYLDAYKRAGLTGERFFFPKRGRDRIRDKRGGDPEVWRDASLSHALKGVLKPISEKIGKPINALILRHTFGSLMIRAGFNYVEVSTIMGNSPEICRRHYARLSPDEVRAAWPAANGAADTTAPKPALATDGQAVASASATAPPTPTPR